MEEALSKAQPGYDQCARKWSSPLGGLALLVAAFAIGASSVACEGDCNRPPILIHAVRVQVVDAASGDPLCGATVTLRRGDASLPTSGTCRRAGGTAPGTYHVTAELTGYQAAETVVSVDEDDCGEAIPEDVTIELTPS